MPAVQKFEIAKRLGIITQQAQEIPERRQNNVNRLSVDTYLKKK